MKIKYLAWIYGICCFSDTVSRMIWLIALDKFNVNSFDAYMVSCLRDTFLIAGKI